MRFIESDRDAFQARLSFRVRPGLCLSFFAKRMAAPVGCHARVLEGDSKRQSLL